MADGGNAPTPPASGTTLRFARRPKVRSANPERARVDEDLAALLDVWLRRTRTSRDAFGECAGHSASYVGKVLATEVPMQLASIVMLPERQALDLLDAVRDLIRDRARIRRAG